MICKQHCCHVVRRRKRIKRVGIAHDHQQHPPVTRKRVQKPHYLGQHTVIVLFRILGKTGKRHNKQFGAVGLAEERTEQMGVSRLLRRNAEGLCSVTVTKKCVKHLLTGGVNPKMRDTVQPLMKGNRMVPVTQQCQR